MDITEAQRARFREAAATLEGIDLAVYEADGRDPLEPIIGLGPVDAPVAIFGRDPGREEIRHGLPFIGAGGQLLRRGLYYHRYGADMPGFDASVEVGTHFFWANTVPYKPLGNKAWSMKAKRCFQPLVAELLVDGWRGRHVITLGREAFMWFGINQTKAIRDALEAFWQRGDRFEASHETALSDGSGRSRALTLHPLPHPSPLNATWYKHFPDLLARRLSALSEGG